MMNRLFHLGVCLTLGILFVIAFQSREISRIVREMNQRQQVHFAEEAFDAERAGEIICGNAVGRVKKGEAVEVLYRKGVLVPEVLQKPVALQDMSNGDPVSVSGDASGFSAHRSERCRASLLIEIPRSYFNQVELQD